LLVEDLCRGFVCRGTCMPIAQVVATPCRLRPVWGSTRADDLVNSEATRADTGEGDRSKCHSEATSIAVRLVDFPWEGQNLLVHLFEEEFTQLIQSLVSGN
jgi:hypothetical protein